MQFISRSSLLIGNLFCFLSALFLLFVRSRLLLSYIKCLLCRTRKPENFFFTSDFREQNLDTKVTCQLQPESIDVPPHVNQVLTSIQCSAVLVVNLLFRARKFTN